MNRKMLCSKAAKYLALRKSLGFQTHNSGPMLYNFVRYVAENCHNGSIPAQLTLDWACSPARSESTQYVRFCLARGFLVHLKASFPEIEIPSRSLIRAPGRPTPYVFSESEVSDLLTAAGKVRRLKRIHPRAAQTLFSLMVCTGLRPGEAIRLRVEDIHFDEHPRLLIRCAKFNKSRWVPMHTTTSDRLNDYLRWRQTQSTTSGALFICRNGKGLNYQCLRRFFLDVVDSLGIRPKTGQLRPSLHSLRHTFAVHRLKSWYEAGSNVNALIPNLSVYLGHAGVTETYWYLSATPELMNSASRLFELYGENGGANR